MTTEFHGMGGRELAIRVEQLEAALREVIRDVEAYEGRHGLTTNMERQIVEKARRALGGAEEKG